MRRIVLTLLLALLAAGLLPAPPAVAGGPTSVMISAPGRAAAGLYYADADYQRLSELVMGVGGDGSSHERGDYVTLTWLIHDVTPWRVDRVYRGEGGTAWVSTREDVGGGDLWAAEPVWHRADPALLRLLGRLLADGDAGTADRAAVATPAVTASGPTTRPVGSLGGLAVGLVAGAALVLGIQRVRARGRAEGPSTAPAVDGPSSDRLAWP